jgi:predicted nucleotidyltransferase
MVVLFGSHARGDWVEDPETGYRSDYDLLVVVENPEVAENHSLWARVREALSPLASPSTVTLIVHDVRELNQEIRRGQFFFAELWEQGVVRMTPGALTSGLTRAKVLALPIRRGPGTRKH